MNKVIGLLAVVVVGLLITVGVLFSRVSAAQEETANLQEQLADVESGAAFALAQLGVLNSAVADFGPGAADSLSEAVDGLDTFASSVIELTVSVDRTVPINTEFVLDRELIVPISTSIPINQTVDTTITIAGPLGTEIPLDVSVPVDLVVPIDLEVPIRVQETIPIDVEVPITLDIPVEIDVAETELATFANSLRVGLQEFADALSQLGG